MMKKLLVFLFLLAAAGASQAATYTVITGTITITNAANLNGTNGAAITVASDTRTWTNAVTSASTQILANTNLVTAASRLVTHLSTYPFTDLKVTASSTNGVNLRALASTALTISLTETNWGVVTYSTNTFGGESGQGVLRIPYSVESATVQSNHANGLVNYLNLTANNVALDQTKTVASELAGLANTQTITGAKTFTNYGNLYTGRQLTLEHAALAVDNGATNFWVDLASSAYRTITATNSVYFQATTNRAATRTVVVRIDPNGTNRNLGFNSNWTFLGTAPSTIASGKIGILSLTSFGTAETDVLAAYGVKDGGSDTVESGEIDTSAELAGILTDETGTGLAVFNDSPTFVDDITIQAAGVKLTGDGDGAITFLGLGNGSDEDFTFNLDDTANTIAVSSSTGVTKFDFGTIDVQVPTEAYDASGWNGDNTVPTKDAVRDKLEALPVAYSYTVGDETTAITAGTGKLTFRVPHAMTVTAVRASLTTAQASGSIFTVDINEAGTTIISTKITIDNTEKTSTTAAAPPVISDSALADDAEITIDVDQVGDGTATGLKVVLIGTR
jgi:hypothetical protein